MADDTSSTRSSWLRPLPLAAFFTPVIAAPSGRGLVPILLIIGLWAFLDMFRGSRRSELKAIITTPLFFWAAVSSVLIVISALWAAAPDQSVEVGLSFAGLAVFGLILLQYAKLQSIDEQHSTRTSLIAGTTLALILLCVGTIYGVTNDQPMWGKEGQHPLSTLSHAQTVLSVFLIPIITILWDRGPKARLFGLAVFAVFVVTYFHLKHSASNLAIIIGLVAFLWIQFSGTRGLIVLCVLISLILILMPFILGVSIPDQTALNAMTSDKGPWPSEIHRLHMWRFVTDAISDGGFLIGYGADASRGFPGANQKIMWGIELMPLHPHNGALQIWLELGIAGVVLIALLPLMILKSAKSLPRAEQAFAAMLLVAYLAPWLLSYGVWQSWWLALGWLTVCIGRGLMAPDIPRT